MPENTQIALLTSKSLPELICSELEGWIAQGKVSPGQPLREADISAQMGLSRGPVREAFRILEERGLVCCEKNRGVRVGNLTLEQVKEIYELRETLEGLIGRLAAERAGAAEKAALKGIVEEMAKAVDAEDVARYTELNFKIHEMLAGCTQMLDLVHLAGESVVPADAAPELRLAANRMTLTDHDTGAAAELLYGMVRRAETSA